VKIDEVASASKKDRVPRDGPNRFAPRVCPPSADYGLSATTTNSL
jgi:hypothetical protein